MRNRLLLFAFLLAVAGCSAARYPGSGRALETYDYCVINDDYGYQSEAASILGESFIILRDDDPRLRVSNIRERTCEVAVNWSRGFWSTTGWVEVTDYETGVDVYLVQTRRGGMWMGAHGDVVESLEEVATARAEGPPPPDESEAEALLEAEAVPTKALDNSSPTGRRLSELEDLYDRGLISRREYDRKRKEILGSL